jgi:hypothetical protein
MWFLLLSSKTWGVLATYVLRFDKSAVCTVCDTKKRASDPSLAHSHAVKTAKVVDTFFIACWLAIVNGLHRLTSSYIGLHRLTSSYKKVSTNPPREDV